MPGGHTVLISNVYTPSTIEKNSFNNRRKIPLKEFDSDSEDTDHMRHVDTQSDHIRRVDTQSDRFGADQDTVTHRSYRGRERLGEGGAPRKRNRYRGKQREQPLNAAGTSNRRSAAKVAERRKYRNSDKRRKRSRHVDIEPDVVDVGRM